MKILINKPVEKLIYKDYYLDRNEILKDGLIITQKELISPMRTRFETNLTRREPHIAFQNDNGVKFIPIKDIISIEYY